MRWPLGILLAAVAVTVARSAPADVESPVVLLVLDGFRWDYAKLLPPGLEGSFHLLKTSGAHVHHVMPIFPSVSYASWTTIATGLWAESHGIVGNHMVDDELGTFSLYNSTQTGRPGWWKDAEPIWTTATRQGVKTAVIGFSRCDVAFSGVRPAFCQPFEPLPGRMPLRHHLALAVNKLDELFKFIIVYAEYVDTVGHYNVQDGRKMRDTINAVDEELKVFFGSLKQREMLEKVNFLLTSDHGMTEIGERAGTKRLYLDLHLSPLLAQHIVDRGAYTQITPKPGTTDQILQELGRMPNVTVYTTEEMPEWMHYANHPRIPPILVVAEPGAIIVGPQTDNAVPRDPPQAWDKVKGIHGYTRNFTDMRTTLYAMGPAFRPGHQQAEMEMVDTYQLLAYLLDVQPRPHNGSWERVSGLLSPAVRPSLSGTAALLVVAAAAARWALV